MDGPSVTTRKTKEGIHIFMLHSQINHARHTRMESLRICFHFNVSLALWQ